MQTQAIELTKIEEGTQAATMTALTAERWRLHAGAQPAAGGPPVIQEPGSQAPLSSQRLVLRTVGAKNVESMTFAAVAELIKDAGIHLLRC